MTDQITVPLNSNTSIYASFISLTILVVAVIPKGLATRLPSTHAIPSTVRVNYEYEPTTFLGWGGFIRNSREIESLLDKLESDGWNTVRYQSVPEWAQPTWGSADIDHAVLRRLIDEAKERDMYVMLNIAHNYYMHGEPPEGFPGFYIDGHREEWINHYIEDATPYKNDDNIILEIVNEYGSNRESHQTEIVAHLNAMIEALRSEGFDQTIQCNFWWNNRIVPLSDPLDNYIVGLHYYGQPFDNYNPETPIDFETACEESGVEDAIEEIFRGPVADAQRQGIPFCTTELGASWTYSDRTIPGGYVYSVGGIAYVMRFLQYAEDQNVSAVMHRIGSHSDYDVYYEKAIDYFECGFWDSTESIED